MAPKAKETSASGASVLFLSLPRHGGKGDGSHRLKALLIAVVPRRLGSSLTVGESIASH